MELKALFPLVVSPGDTLQLSEAMREIEQNGLKSKLRDIQTNNYQSRAMELSALRKSVGPNDFMIFPEHLGLCVSSDDDAELRRPTRSSISMRRIRKRSPIKLQPPPAGAESSALTIAEDPGVEVKVLADILSPIVLVSLVLNELVEIVWNAWAEGLLKRIVFVLFNMFFLSDARRPRQRRTAAGGQQHRRQSQRIHIEELIEGDVAGEAQAPRKSFRETERRPFHHLSLKRWNLSLHQRMSKLLVRKRRQSVNPSPEQAQDEAKNTLIEDSEVVVEAVAAAAAAALSSLGATSAIADLLNEFKAELVQSFIMDILAFSQKEQQESEIAHVLLEALSSPPSADTQEVQVSLCKVVGGAVESHDSEVEAEPSPSDSSLSNPQTPNPAANSNFENVQPEVSSPSLSIHLPDEKNLETPLATPQSVSGDLGTPLCSPTATKTVRFAVEVMTHEVPVPDTSLLPLLYYTEEELDDIALEAEVNGDFAEEDDEEAELDAMRAQRAARRKSHMIPLTDNTESSDDELDLPRSHSHSHRPSQQRASTSGFRGSSVLTAYLLGDTSTETTEAASALLGPSTSGSAIRTNEFWMSVKGAMEKDIDGLYDDDDQSSDSESGDLPSAAIAQIVAISQEEEVGGDISAAIPTTFAELDDAGMYRISSVEAPSPVDLAISPLSTRQSAVRISSVRPSGVSAYRLSGGRAVSSAAAFRVSGTSGAFGFSSPFSSSTVDSTSSSSSSSLPSAHAAPASPSPSPSPSPPRGSHLVMPRMSSRTPFEIPDFSIPDFDIPKLDDDDEEEEEVDVGMQTPSTKLLEAGEEDADVTAEDQDDIDRIASLLTANY